MRMYRVLLSLAFALLLFGAPAFSADKPAQDPVKVWEEFLARGDYAGTVAAYDALEAVGYEGAGVDPELCRQNSAALATAIATVPVSIALLRADYLCADAIGNQASAEVALTRLVTLSRHALKQAGDPAVARPIPVPSPADAYALLASSGVELSYEYYSELRAKRYYPLILVGWDDEAKIERHYTFDYIDVLQGLKVDNPYRGLPIMRDGIAHAFIEGGAKGEGLAATDAMALKSAAAVGMAADKLAKLRGAAGAGGAQSAKAWLLLCASNPQWKDCGEGLIDVLMDQAELKRGMPMALLAYAYFDGVGTPADAESAWALLDAAEKRWPGHATVEFASLWAGAHQDTALPAKLAGRLAGLQDSNRAAQRFLVWRKVYSDKAALGADDVAFLGGPQENGLGLGYSVLADYHAAAKQPEEEYRWRVKAAEAGQPSQQAWYAAALLFGNDDNVARDEQQGMRFMQAAAHGGNAWAARYLSDRSVRAGDYVAAEGWLLAPGDAGDIAAIMQLADLYADERPGVSAGLKRAVELYRMLANQGEHGAPARRALAELALEGRGTDKDPQQALRWLVQDAERGDHASELMLAGQYFSGGFGKADEAEGLRWVQRAIKAGDQDAVTSYGAWLYYDKNTEQSRSEALQLLAEADAAGNQGATNNYVWLLCTSPRKEVYDPGRGLELSKRLGNPETMAPGALDTLAACHAANGDFAKAVQLQTRAAQAMAAYVPERERKKRNGKPFGFERRLGLYKESKRYEEFDRNE